MHIDDGTDAVALLHRLESVVDLAESLAVGDELVDLEITLLVVGDKVVQLRAALDTTECTSSPHSAGNKLESCRKLVSSNSNAIRSKLTSSRDFLTSSSNTDDNALTPTLVASLEGSTHDTNVASAVEGVVTTTISHLNELILDGLVTKLGGVHEVSSTELVTPGLLGGVDINNNDLASLTGSGTLND